MPEHFIEEEEEEEEEEKNREYITGRDRKGSAPGCTVISCP